MKINIQRFCSHREPNSILIKYDIPLEDCTLLQALTYIKTKKDPTLTFNSNCKSEICGSCAMRVNGKEELACGYKIKEGDLIEPLSKMDVIKDLVVEQENALETLSKTGTWFPDLSSKFDMSIEEEKRVELQTDCILCTSCYSACPVLEVNKNFLGPFALTRAYRYTNDSRFSKQKELIDKVQADGIWDCTLCGECTIACPQNIDPKHDIMMLRSKSIQFGYSDPTFANTNEFNDFGFNPDF
jgi:succinate dehydrogenase/fumarate reductase iron-sulfur protein